MNELLFFITIIINFLGIILVYKFFGKTGIFVWIGFATIMSNIEVAKNIDVFGLPLTLGNVIYGTTFLATDILSERYGGKEARKGVYIGFFTLIIFTLMSQVNLLFIPNENDYVHEAMKTIFSIMPRICFASIVAYLISNIIDTYLFDIFKKISPKYLWLRNNLATILSQFIDSILFTIIAFVGVFKNELIVELILTTFLIKIIIALCDTPFLYLAVRIDKGR